MIKELSEIISTLILFFFSKKFKFSIKFSFKKSEIFLQTFNSTNLALLIIDLNSTYFKIFCAKDSSVSATFHLTALSLNLCRDISSNPKLLILPI